MKYFLKYEGKHKVLFENMKYVKEGLEDVAVYPFLIHVSPFYLLPESWFYPGEEMCPIPGFISFPQFFL